MSAFTLDNKHIAVMVSKAGPRYPGDGMAYYWKGEAHYFGGHLQEIGQKLVDENFRSVNFRYSHHNDPEEPFTFRHIMLRDYSPIEIIAACDCYDYQTCETSDWQETEAWAIMHALRERAISLLKDAADTPWAIYDDAETLAAPVIVRLA